VQNVEVTLFWDYEYAVRSDEQPVDNQFNWHRCVMRENLMEKPSYSPEVIDDDDSNAHIWRQMS